MLEKPLLATVIGAVLLGVGMSLAGACPGMVLPQVGAWATNSVYTLLGALLGALVYGLLHDRVYKLLFRPIFIPPPTVSSYLKWNYSLIALPMGFAVLLAAILMEIFIPWKEELGKIRTPGVLADDPFTTIAWPPIVAGVLIGLMQLVIVFSVNDTLGGSTSYVTVVAQPFFHPKCKELFPYLYSKRTGIGNWWQVIYVAGGILGGLFSALCSDSLGKTPGVTVPYAFIGGFVLLFGARLASGCTSGHGLSGTGLLFISSFIAVPCMFAGGIGTAFILKACNAIAALEQW